MKPDFEKLCKDLKDECGNYYYAEVNEFGSIEVLCPNIMEAAVENIIESNGYVIRDVFDKDLPAYEAVLFVARDN